uniref:HTH CENPB-type domain-containing protein n=1 Tax=Caenorhabditis tropicalis TaxID=1561998 RepID=A0A1I7UKP6_9PELO
MAAKRILQYVSDHWNNNAKRFHLEDKELRAAKTILEILNSAEEGDFAINSEEFFTDFEDDTRDKEAAIYFGSKQGLNNNGTKVRPPLATMKKLFPFIKDENHLKKLREYEANGDIKKDRLNNLAFLSEELKKVVTTRLQEGAVLHDDSLRFFIAQIVKEFNLKIDNFSASNQWLAKWKRGFGLTSRKITKFVAILRHKNKDQLEKDAKEFVEKTNREMTHYNPSSIFNADQSGFQLEMHTARTLAITGSKHVHCVVQSVSNSTHSYTVLPLVSADGKLHKKLFITLKESKGKFPKKGHFQADNLFVTCHTSHIMTKELMKTFFENVVFDPAMPKDSLLILDSWSSWKDQSAIDSVTPSSNKCKVLVIPAGCTGLVQPCDVGLFGGFKKVVKTITGHGQLTNPKYKMFSRDATLKMISLVWWQLCHSKLEDWVRYAWHASGYNLPRPSQFFTPAQLLFPRDVARDCEAAGCLSTSFIRCIYCESHFCFKDFTIEDWILFATQTGLFFTNLSQPRVPFRIAGPSSVISLEIMAEINCVAMVVNKQRQLALVPLDSLTLAMQSTQPSIRPECLPEFGHVHAIKYHQQNGQRYLLISDDTHVHIRKYNGTRDVFSHFAKRMENGMSEAEKYYSY